MRGKRAPKRKLEPDLKYQSVTVAKFINKVMIRGQKETAKKSTVEVSHHPVSVVKIEINRNYSEKYTRETSQKKEHRRREDKEQGSP